MPFFDYSQNNSFGRMVENSSVHSHVIIEAETADKANERAQEIGLYFDGCESGIDCSCCGDRWYRHVYDDYGEDEPCVYGTPVEKWVEHFRTGRTSAYEEGVWVYFADGRQVGYGNTRNHND